MHCMLVVEVHSSLQGTKSVELIRCLLFTVNVPGVSAADVVDEPADDGTADVADGTAGVADGTAAAGTGAELEFDGDAGAGAGGIVEPDVAGGDAAGAEVAARRRLHAPRLLSQHQHQQPQRALQGLPEGTRLSMGAVRQLLQDQALEAASGTPEASIISDEDKIEASKKTPTTTADGCKIANKAWRFGGSVPNRTCDKVPSQRMPPSACTARMYAEN